MKPIFLILILALALTACAPKPLDVANEWQAALNKGDIDAALSFLADDATVSIVPPGPDGDGIYNGHAEIRGWYETIVAAKGLGSLRDCKADGETLTCLSTYTDEGLKSMGVDSIEGSWVAKIRDGRIQSYTFTISPESLAKFPPPPAAEPTEPPVEEVRITSAEAMVGIWKGKSGDYVVLHYFNADGTMKVHVSGVGVIASGPYVFENDLLKFQDSTGDCEGIVATYEVYGTYENGKLVKLRFVLVGDDACSDRRKTLDGKTLVPN